jgi:hypothetical protein
MAMSDEHNLPALTGDFAGEGIVAGLQRLIGNLNSSERSTMSI